MKIPGFVAEVCLYDTKPYRGFTAAAQDVRAPVAPAYGPDECYDDCMATSRDGSRASRRFARFCAVACG
jgi:hypothetical protein